MRRSLLLVLAVTPRLLVGQGVTTAAIQGTVVSVNGEALAGATVRIVHAENGRSWEVVTRPTGGYLVEAVAVGGLYRIDVRALGFAPETRDGIVLRLGQRLVADFALRPAAIELSPVTAQATIDPALSPGRTGPAEIVSAGRIATLPNIGRDFLALTLLSPQVARSPTSRFTAPGGITIGGQNRLLNGFQIDGGVNQDLFSGLLPGRETLPRPIALDALEQLQVLVAPFDVRYGGFAGGLVNAVTRSGTNAVHGTAFAYLGDDVLVGRGAAGGSVEPFTAWQYGGTLSGPIARDRAHFFVSIDAQKRAIPDPGPLITDTVGGADMTNIGVSHASGKRFQDILRNTYGLDPGTLGPADGGASAADVFGKVTVQLGRNSHLELSHHYSAGDRRDRLSRQFGDYFLSSVGRREPATVHAPRLIWTTLPGDRWSNELIISYLRQRTECRPNAGYPLIRADADRGRVIAGTPTLCPNSIGQDALALTDNVTTVLGSHVLTMGTHLDLLRIRDGALAGGAGVWDFRSLDSLEAGQAFHYDRALPGPARGAVFEFHARQVALYVQDRWRLTGALTVTAGLRFDVPVLPDGIMTYRPLKDSLGLDTGRLPSGRVLWSPRLGVSYDARPDGSTILRGGIGLFAGRAPHAWIAGGYRYDGTQQLFLSCDGGAVRPFDPIDQPTTCADGTGPTPRLSAFDADVTLPQIAKASFGLDHRLPGGIVGTIDVLYTRTRHQWYFSDANLAAPVGVARGEGGRPLYGTIAAGGAATPRRPAPSLGQVVRVSDRGRDEAVSVAVQVRKRLADRAEVSALYARTRARDRLSIAANAPRPNLENAPVVGTLEDRPSGTSYYEIPHRLEITATVRLPYRVHLSLLYAGASGTPYTYVIRGDANADGIGGSIMRNDIVYVPRDSADIALVDPAQWNALNDFIEAEPCLRRQRGRLLARNSCRNPWFGTLSARLAKVLPAGRGRSVELTADIQNVLNLLDRRWGQARFTTLAPWVELLTLVGYDATAGRGIYRTRLPGFRQILDQGLVSRWQAELGLRYVF